MKDSTSIAASVPAQAPDSGTLQLLQDGFAALTDLAGMLASKATLQEILDMATRQLVESMNLKASSLRLLDPDANELKLASVANLSKEYLSKGPVRLADSSIDQAALSGETVYVEDCRSDPRIIYPQMASEEGLVSALVTGVRFRGRRVGALWAYRGEERRFSEFEASLLEAIAAQLAAAIINARLRADLREAEDLERQVKHAAEVQRRMIPASPPESPHYRFGCIYQPSKDLAGDFYDFIRFENGDLGVIVADVVGKGVPASLMMASARSALRANARRMTDLGEIMQSVNRRLEYDTLPAEFATAFYVELSHDGAKAKYCNAGHEPLLLLRGGQITSLDVGGMVLGINEQERYESAEIALQPGDTMLLYTDGVTEALDYQDRAYGRERVYKSLITHGTADGASAEFIAKQILWDVRRFVGLAPQSDDITVVAIRVSE